MFAPCRPLLAARSLPPAPCRPLLAALNATLLTLTLCLALPGHAAPAPTPAATPAPPPVIPWDKGRQGGFVTALTGDRQGHVWAATEDNGVWEYSPSAPVGKQWTQFTTKNTNGGLGDDDIYSLTCDKLGRVWAGTGRDGVSVFNGRTWQTYDRLTGPLGCHVVALATSPLTGDVWGATEAGLFSYSLTRNAWRYVTRADGLPSDQATCLAFTRTGTLIVGTNCDGVASASPDNGYRTWGTALGPDAMPITRRGRGLPSSLINCLLVSREGTVYAGTTTGLARSENEGQTWKFVRGDDWRDKVLGLYQGPQPVAATTDNVGVLEDWVTALAEDGAGRLYVGHRQKGLEVLDPVTGARVDDAKSTYGGFVDALLPTSQGHVFIGTYGDGLTQTQGAAPGVADVAVKPPAMFPPMPLPAAPPTAASLASLLHQVQGLPGALPVGGAAYLGEDWQTQGDWVGRYGRQYARLSAMSITDHLLTWNPGYSVEPGSGPHRDAGDSVRYWIQWLRTDDPRCLYSPLVGYRREAEWDDHGEAYSRSFSGPDIWIRTTLPQGDVHRISLYFVNPNGHDGEERLRDYLIEIRPYRDSFEEAEAAPVLARARVRDFWGGVYEQFAVRGPGQYLIRIAKNGSMNTLCSGVFLDRLTGPAYFMDGRPMAYMGTVHYDPPAADVSEEEGSQSGATAATAKAACALWSALDDYAKPGDAVYQWPARLMAYRAMRNAVVADSLLASWRWQMRLWTETDRQQFRQTTAQSWQSYQSQIVPLHTAQARTVGLNH